MLTSYNANRCKQLGTLNLAILEQADLLDSWSYKDRDLTMGKHNGLAIDLREGANQHRRQQTLILRLNILAKELHAPTV
jgi:hypothetical protein